MHVSVPVNPSPLPGLCTCGINGALSFRAGSPTTGPLTSTGRGLSGPGPHSRRGAAGEGAKPRLYLQLLPAPATRPQLPRRPPGVGCSQEHQTLVPRAGDRRSRARERQTPRACGGTGSLPPPSSDPMPEVRSFLMQTRHRCAPHVSPLFLWAHCRSEAAGPAVRSAQVESARFTLAAAVGGHEGEGGWLPEGAAPLAHGAVTEAPSGTRVQGSGGPGPLAAQQTVRSFAARSCQRL